MKQKYIYSDKDFWDKWELLMQEAEKYCIRKNVNFNRNTRLNTLVTAILSYRGLNRTQIAALKNKDITPEGIVGYNITFDNKSMSVLLACKKFTDKDEQYIWNSRDMEVKEQTLSDFFSKRRIGDSETASLFKPFTLNNAYRFHNLTQYCNKHNINIMFILSHEFSNIRPYYKAMCDILGLTYIKNNNTALIKLLYIYATDYLRPLKELESSYVTKK